MLYWNLQQKTEHEELQNQTMELCHHCAKTVPRLNNKNKTTFAATGRTIKENQSRDAVVGDAEEQTGKESSTNGLRIFKMTAPIKGILFQEQRRSSEGNLAICCFGDPQWGPQEKFQIKRRILALYLEVKFLFN